MSVPELVPSEAPLASVGSAGAGVVDAPSVEAPTAPSSAGAASSGAGAGASVAGAGAASSGGAVAVSADSGVGVDVEAEAVGCVARWTLEPCGAAVQSPKPTALTVSVDDEESRAPLRSFTPTAPAVIRAAVAIPNAALAPSAPPIPPA